MKFHIFLYSAIVFSMFGCNNSECIVFGNAVGLNDAKVYLLRSTGQEYKFLDSAYMKYGRFVFEIEEVYPELLYLKSDKFQIPFIAESGKVMIDIDFSEDAEVFIHGTPSNEFLNVYRHAVKAFDNNLDSLKELYLNYSMVKDSSAILTLSLEIQMRSDHKKNELAKLLKDNNRLYGATFILSEEVSEYNSFRKIDSLLAIVYDQMPNNSFTDKITQRRNILYNVSEGKNAPDFMLFTPMGEKVKFSNLITDITILDFWNPSGEEYENLNRAYRSLLNTYRSEGLSIVSVYVGNDIEEWRNNLNKSDESWVNLSGLRGWDGEAVRLYGVANLPHNVIIDKDGVIIKNNCFG